MPVENIDQILASLTQGETVSNNDVPTEYGDFGDFIQSISHPPQIGVGEEIVATNRPFVT